VGLKLILISLMGGALNSDEQKIAEELSAPPPKNNNNKQQLETPCVFHQVLMDPLTMI
jgi:hypothetical protein